MPFTWFRDFCEETHFFGQLPEKCFFDKCHPQHNSTNFVEKYPPLPLNLFQLYSIPFGVKIFKWRYPDTHLCLLRISLFHSLPSFWWIKWAETSSMWLITNTTKQRDIICQWPKQNNFVALGTDFNRTENLEKLCILSKHTKQAEN